MGTNNVGPTWLREFARGYDPARVTLHWEGVHLAVVHVAGSMCWSGIGCQSYHRSETRVVFKDKRRPIMTRRSSFCFDDRASPLLGRTKRADVAALIEKAKELDVIECSVVVPGDRPVPPPAPQYPEHDRLKAIQQQSETCGDFLEWLRGQGIELCRFVEEDGDEPEGFAPIHERIEVTLARRFGIDLKVLEAEKQKMLANQRALNAQSGIR